VEFATSLITMGTYLLYGITQCYLPRGRGNISAITLPFKADT